MRKPTSDDLSLVIESLHTLILDSHPTRAEALAAELQKAGLPCQPERVECEKSFREGIANGFDLILASDSVPEFSALEALDVLRATGVVKPLIVVGGAIGEEAAAECIKRGAADFVSTANLARLAQAVRATLDETRRDADQRRIREMEVAAKLAAGIGHDFNNLLTVVSGYSSMLIRQPQLPASVKSKLQEIDDASRRATQLTAQLMAFARKHVRRPELLDVNGLVAGMEPVLQTLLRPGIELRLKPEPDVALVYADVGEIEQVVLNLASNAVDAMPAGGILEIETGSWDESAVALAIRDNGCGMDRETQSRIFEPYFTTKPNGKSSGMGLAIAFGIVAGIGGRIHVKSAVGDGSTFKIVLPRAGPAVSASLESEREPLPVTSAAAAPAISKAFPIRRETILVVEDQDALRDLVLFALDPQGYQILEARNAAEAIDLCASHGPSIDLLLTDVNLPHIPGTDLATMVRESHPQIKTVFMSGGEAPQDSMQSLGGVFFQKPFSPKTLAAKIREVLDSRVSPSVMVVDDDPQIRNLLSNVLGEAGYHVIAVESGRQALEQMAHRMPNLLITDIIMPDVEGMEMITHIRKTAPGLKVVAMSGSTDRLYLEAAKVLGARAAFTKPLELDRLLATVRELLDQN